jgi:hypothetical protein
MAPTTVNVSTVPAIENRTGLYRAFPDAGRFPAGEGAELVYNNVTGARDMITATAAVMLRACDKFATLDGHLQQLRTQFKVPESEIPGLRDSLNHFVEAGFLVSREELIRDYVLKEPQKSQEDGDAKLSHVGIPTCNRPDSLHACLTNFAESVQRLDRDMHFVISDDSRDDAVCALNIEVLQAVKRQFGIEISYIGKAEKEALAKALAKQTGLPQSILDFAIRNPENCPITTGANRNTLVLSTVGRLFLHADDDTLCRAVPVPDSRSHITLSSESISLQEAWFDEALMDGGDWPIVDVFSLHERFLGKSLSDCVRGASSELSIDSARASFYRRLKQSGGRVLVTTLGTAGDSGALFSNQYLQFDDATRARLMQSELVYRRAFESHRQVRGVVSPTISDAQFCLPMNAAFDNRAQLPPFTPVQRTSDMIFGRLVRATIYDALFGFMPWTILHGRPCTKKHELDGGWSLMGEILFSVLQQSEAVSFCQSKDSEANLRNLGTDLMRVGSMPRAEFEELVMVRRWMHHADTVATLQRLLEKYGGQPSYWFNDVVSHVQGLQKALLQPQYVVASDLADAFGEEAARAMAPRLIFRFGELLQNWTTIRKAAADLDPVSSLARKI